MKSRSPDVKILGLINNFTDLTWQAKNIADSINTPEKRQKIDDTILEHLKVNGLSGVSIDFENIPLSAQNNYVLFLEELSSILHKNNYIITVNLPANDNNFQYANISKIVDYVVLMAYDEHWTTSTPGAIASINWFNTILESHSQDIPSEKMIIAL
ncbi:MAG: glycosyl hydrolase family 18 protein [bacterium]